MKTSVPTSSAIEKIPTDHASLEAILGFILAVDSAAEGIRIEGWKRNAIIGANPHAARVVTRRSRPRRRHDQRKRRRKRPKTASPRRRPAPSAECLAQIGR